MDNLGFNREGEKNITLLSPNSDGDKKSEGNVEDKVSLDKNIGLTSCVGLIVGTVIGSGIFISPKGVLTGSGSVGLTLIIWVICGFFSFMGALAFTELGTLLPSSGGQYIYYLEGFAPKRKKEKQFWSPLLAFLYSWQVSFFLRPAGIAVQSLACATYILKFVHLGCSLESISEDKGDLKVKLIATTFVIVVTTINCYSVKFSTRIINIFSTLKLLALTFIIVGGIITLSQGEVGALSSGFEGTNFGFNGLAMAFYSGLYAYAGWDNLTLVGREIKDPQKNILRAMLISCSLITVIYVATNVSYFAMMTKTEFLSSDAVAVDFGRKFVGFYGGVFIVLSVASSIFGSTTGGTFTSVRITYAAAREGHLMDIFSFLNMHYSTPTVALMFTTFLSLFMIGYSDILSLIFASGFVDSIFMAICMALVFVFRKTRENDERIKINLMAPGIAFLFYIFLIVTPFIEHPKLEYLYSLVFLIAGFIVYVPFVYYQYKFDCIDKIKEKVQIILEVVPPQDDEI